MIPFQLKFGGEKGRIAIIGAVGLLVVAGVVLDCKRAKLFFNVDLIAQLNTLPIVSMGMLFLIALVIAMLLFALLCEDQYFDYEKKQFKEFFLNKREYVSEKQTKRTEGKKSASL